MERNTGDRIVTHFVADIGEQVRFYYDAENWLEVQMNGGVLRVRASGATGDGLTVTPEVPNVVHVYPLRWHPNHEQFELLPIKTKRREAIVEAAVEVLEVADLRGDTELPHPANDPKLWTARMQTAWGAPRAATEAEGGKEKR